MSKSMNLCCEHSIHFVIQFFEAKPTYLKLPGVRIPFAAVAGQDDSQEKMAPFRSKSAFQSLIFAAGR